MSEIATEFPFPTALSPVRAPEGYHPIEVVQFWRGKYPTGTPLPLHWTLVIRTSSDRGSCYEVVGDMYSYTTQSRFNVSLSREYQREDWRGNHVIGYVSPDRLDYFLNRIALGRVVRHQLSWNCQNWVYEALVGLDFADLYVDPNMTFGTLREQMNCLLEAWETGEI